MPKKKIVIIGAGPAGLAAAGRILQDDASSEYDVVVLESDTAVGGLSKTVCHNGNRMDLGGHRFFTKVPEVNDWWNELLPPQSEQLDPENTDAVFMRRNRLSRIYFNNTFFPYPITLNPSLLIDLGLMDSLKVIGSYLKSVLKKREENSLEDFYINRFGRKLYTMFFEYYTENLWGVHPRDISPEWGYQRVKGLSISSAIKNMLGSALHLRIKKETSLIDSFSYPKFGPGQLWEKAAESITERGGRILMNSTVTGIRIDPSGSEVFYETDGTVQSLPADFILSSMPMCDLIRCMEFAPDEIREYAAKLPYRDFITIGVLFPRKDVCCGKNKNKNLMDNWIYIQDRSVKMGRIQIFNNWSPYMVKDPENTVWMGLEYFCNENDELWRLPAEEFAEMAVRELKRIGLIRAEAETIDYHIEHIRKAYPSYFGGYENIEKIKRFIDGIPNLVCIGRNGQHRYNNMDHSTLTGFEAARFVTGRNSDKRLIWNVNTEKEYLEVKKER